MSVVRNSDAIDNMMRVAFDDRAIAVYRASTFVADTGNGDTTHSKSGGRDVDNLAAVTVGVIQTDDVTHDRFSFR
jgi:hypothetical protein